MLYRYYSRKLMIVKDMFKNFRDGVINYRKKKNFKKNLINQSISQKRFSKNWIRYKVEISSIILLIFLCIEEMLLVGTIGAMAEMMRIGTGLISIPGTYFKNKSSLTCKNHQLLPTLFSMSKSQTFQNLITNFITKMLC